MVDFRQQLKKKPNGKPLDPAVIYEGLDRASDKGPLRPAQAAILSDWHKTRREERDTILKLHTGQGKTLIGLLILQSRLNEAKGPAVYLCPNNYLVSQTCTQADQFGVRYVTAMPGEPLPDEFHNSERILITSVQKFFNGRSKFGIGAKSTAVGSIVMDDSHACVDAIRDAFAIRLPKDHPLRTKLLDLFSYEMEKQGGGTFHEIRQGHHEAFLPVPYWDWLDKISEITAVLAANNTDDQIKFAWPLLKDMLAHCQCLISGNSLEISPFVPKLELFGSYAKASHRTFMSATVTDDSFLVKGLGLSSDTILKPLTYASEQWSGEKMILIPSLIDDSLTTDLVSSAFAQPQAKRKLGFVALVPSFAIARDTWQPHGALVAEKSSIDSLIEGLRKGKRDETLVIVNRYDGIDLPDDTCRVLILDSKPYADALLDRYAEQCRPNSDAIAARVARVVEQGLGRSVRGEKDYAAILIIGAELVKFVRSLKTRQFFSDQTRAQIDIGMEIAEYAKADIAKGTDAWTAFMDLIFVKLLSRDEGWKEFYTERMNAMKPAPAPSKMLAVFAEELAAERAAQLGMYDQAAAAIQQLVDKHVQAGDRAERGWYVQEMARYYYSVSKQESNRLQVEAHKQNTYLLKPKTGMIIPKLVIVAQDRMERIIEWISACGNFENFRLSVEAVLTDLEFGIPFKKFEKAVDDIGKLLGADTQRPDSETGAGPDNLWAYGADQHLIIECKNEVDVNRAEIYKTESGQISNSIGWFKEQYPSAKYRVLVFHPGKQFGKGAAVATAVEGIGPRELPKLRDRIRAFVAEFRDLDLKALTAKNVQTIVDAHELHVEDVLSKHAKRIKTP